MRSVRPSQRASARTWLTVVIAVSLLLAECLIDLYSGPLGAGANSTTRLTRLTRLTHFTGGFGLYSAASVHSAAALGITTAFLYGSADSETTAALEAQKLSRIEAKPWSFLLGYECSQLTRIGKSWAACANRNPVLTQQALLQNIGAYLRGVQHDPWVVGYWILDDWPLFDPGAARSLLPAITHLVHELTPGRPTICGFGAGFGPQHRMSLDPALTANYTPGACDMVALYIYSSSVTDPTISPRSFDWSMDDVLPQVERALQAHGWNPARVPLIGVAQAWGGARTDVPGAYEIVPTAANLAEQSKIFCQSGATGIVYYSWFDSTVADIQTPANNDQLAQGMRQGIAACKRVWATQAAAGTRA